tara:strand:- start:67 stop:420 length:354 start_codon:yes stop_codon:yes gene_type:complete
MAKDEVEDFIEKMGLARGNYYIILQDVGNDKFKMMAYDTTGKKHKKESDHSVASVMHEALVGLITTKGEDLFNFGFSELAYRYTTGRMFDEILDEEDKLEEVKYRDNIIEVDFGKDR